jgi:uncharacterized protein YhbP (UPF0306 family)
VDVKPQELAAALLREQTTLALATTALDGSPHLAPLFYYAGDGLVLYWLSSASSKHSRDLARDPRAAVTVYRPASGWREIRGVQMRGVAEVVTDRSERRRVVDAYCERFQLGVLFRPRIARSRLYRFRPAWARYLDNSVRLGYKVDFLP